MKISEQIAAGRAHLAGPGEADTDEISIYSCWAIAYACEERLFFLDDPAAKWYLGWLQDIKATYSQMSTALSEPVSQELRFLLMCFAELAAIDEGL